MNEGWLEASGLGKTYRTVHREVEVLKGVDLSVAPGEVVSITGESGSGKSTLLNLLGCLDRPDAGSILWGSRDAWALSDGARSQLLNAEIGFVFQSHHLLGDFTALENVLMPVRAGRGIRSADRERALDLLGRVGLDHRLEHRPGELSGGEQQRVAVARALINQPKLVLADEPGGNLDHARAEDLHGLLLALGAETGAAVVVVTHDEALAARADRWMHLQAGTLALRANGSKTGG